MTGDGGSSAAAGTGTNERKPMHFYELSKQNRSRAERWHSGAALWTGADWSNAMCGEAGEAANVVKKLRRHETGIIGVGSATAGLPYNTPPEYELHGELAAEIADVILYADLLARHYGIDTETAVVHKFNIVSAAQGFPERLSGE